MNSEYQQYRFARIEAHNLTRHTLESQFRNGVTDNLKLEAAVHNQLTPPGSCTPWHTSQIAQTGAADGRRLAALEFFWAHRRQLDRAS